MEDKKKLLKEARLLYKRGYQIEFFNKQSDPCEIMLGIELAKQAHVQEQEQQQIKEEKLKKLKYIYLIENELIDKVGSKGSSKLLHGNKPFVEFTMEEIDQEIEHLEIMKYDLEYLKRKKLFNKLDIQKIIVANKIAEATYLLFNTMVDFKSNELKSKESLEINQSEDIENLIEK